MKSTVADRPSEPDIVERLRDWDYDHDERLNATDLMDDAADEIEWLRVELREVLSATHAAPDLLEAIRKALGHRRGHG
jgi:hypothetical protein